MSSFITTYGTDFTPKSIKLESRRQEPQKENPLTLPFHSYLKLDSKQLEDEREEYGTTFLETKVKPNKGIEKNHFQNPIDQEEIQNYLKMNNYTTYTIDYCNGHNINLHSKKELLKNENFVKDFTIQSTTYRKAYREPRLINNNAYDRKLGKAQATNLGLSSKILKLLNIMGDRSEYGDVISNLGGQIIRDQMYGEIKH